MIDDIVRNDTDLPIQCPREELEACGFVFGEPVDPYRVAATFPRGWYTVSQWPFEFVFDDRGEKQFSLFPESMRSPFPIYYQSLPPEVA